MFLTILNVLERNNLTSFVSKLFSDNK